MGVSKNNGTPKSSILIGFSIINHPFWGTPIFGNTQMVTFWMILSIFPSSKKKMIQFDIWHPLLEFGEGVSFFGGRFFGSKFRQQKLSILNVQKDMLNAKWVEQKPRFGGTFRGKRLYTYIQILYQDMTIETSQVSLSGAWCKLSCDSLALKNQLNSLSKVPPTYPGSRSVAVYLV